MAQYTLEAAARIYAQAVLKHGRKGARTYTCVLEDAALGAVLEGRA